jgi:hypothetical protein
MGAGIAEPDAECQLLRWLWLKQNVARVGHIDRGISDRCPQILDVSRYPAKPPLTKTVSLSGSNLGGRIKSTCYLPHLPLTCLSIRAIRAWSFVIRRLATIIIVVVLPRGRSAYGRLNDLWRCHIMPASDRNIQSFVSREDEA